MRHIYLIFGILSSSLYAQKDTLNQKVILSDISLIKINKYQPILTLNDSIIKQNNPLLTQIINQNSGIYFKENGLGMVSSPSFRGTTASQTAVLWNGININSVFNGQTDFNTVNVAGFDNLSIVSGGSSVLDGSGAIGGSIHLNQTLRFKSRFNQYAQFSYGSFGTLGFGYKTDYANDNFNLKVSYNRLQSENDYDYPDDNGKNLNGKFYNNSIDVAVGKKLNSHNILSFFSNFYDGKRNFSLISQFATPTSYRDKNSRFLADWQSDWFADVKSDLKMAYIKEAYQYYPDNRSDYYTNGEAQTVLGRFDLSYNIKPNMLLSSVSEYTHNEANGSSMATQKRDNFYSTLFWNHSLKKFNYTLSIRKDFPSDYKAPLLYNTVLSYDTKYYSISFSHSKNFRIPTYNDLYWESLGNPDLKPEKSYQYELRQIFKVKGIEFNLSAYRNDISDMIRWIPVGSNWRPVNTDKVKISGLESQLKYDFSIGKNYFTINAGYNYTLSRDQQTHRQLIYVPYHKGNAGIQYQWKNISLGYHLLYVGEVYTKSDYSGDLDQYLIHNLNLNIQFFKEKLWLGFKVNNFTNESYQSVENRWMPGINYSGNIQFNF